MSTRRLRRTSRQLYRLCVVDRELNPNRVREVVRALAASKRRETLALLVHFERLVRLNQHRHVAAVESAAPLPANVRKDLHGALTRMYGSQLETSFAENAWLIGGMRIRVGSDVFDGSVRMRLAALGGHELARGV